MTGLDLVINSGLWIMAFIAGFLIAPEYAAWRAKRKTPPKKRKPRVAKVKIEEGAGAENPHARAIDQHANARDKNWQP